MIEIKQLSKNYGDRPAIADLSFKVRPGEVVGFLGPNGAGKSTTMKIITGYMAPSSGSVEVGGFDVFEFPIEVKKKIGYLPETPPVYGDMYVKDYLAFVARLRGTPREKIETQVDRALEKTQLGDVRGRLIQNLSKGFRQRVGLAQALVSDPEVLILDEPSVGLDPRQVAEMRKLIGSLKGEHTIILSTHILPEVQANCERIIIINEGKIVAEDTIGGLSQRMQGQNQLKLRVLRKADQLKEKLDQLESVSRAELNSEQILISLTGTDQNVEEVAKIAVEMDCGLIELQSQALGLEDIFIKLTSGTEEKGGIQ